MKVVYNFNKKDVCPFCGRKFTSSGMCANCGAPESRDRKIVYTKADAAKK